jgi:hypothetical protein
MEDRSIIKRVVGALTGSTSPRPGCEMPETPNLKLPEGKISTATRKKLLPLTPKPE